MAGAIYSSVQCSASPLLQALNFAFKDEIQKKFKVGKNASKKERFSKNILSGGCAGSLSLVFVQSIDYTRWDYSLVINITMVTTITIAITRTRLGVDAKRPGGERQFSGIMDVYVKTIRKDGWVGLYRGFGISCCCIFIYRGLYFGLFDSLKPLGGK
jgi:solute carrier family 25 (adenine nucleotide translocator) protein 4/5/6/31